MAEPESRSGIFQPLENPLARAARDGRYHFALRHLHGGRTLEAGCGARDGAVRLVARSAGVVAVDVSVGAVRLAAEAHADPRIRYAAMDCQRLGLRDGSFDAVVSFEVLEHVPDSEAYVREIARVLRPGGLHVGSTPNRERPAFRPNPDHVREFSAAELADLLGRHFVRVDLLGQWPAPVVAGRGLELRRGMTRLDRLGLRRLVPQRVKDVLNRVVFDLKSAHLVGPDDYEFRAREHEGAPVLAYVCRKGEGRP